MGRCIGCVLEGEVMSSRLLDGVVVEVLGNGPPAATVELVGAIDGYVGEVYREQETGRTPYEVCERFAG